jgi:hypothetical protein
MSTGRSARWITLCAVCREPAPQGRRGVNIRLDLIRRFGRHNPGDEVAEQFGVIHTFGAGTGFALWTIRRLIAARIPTVARLPAAARSG